MAIECRTISADESYFKIADRKAEAAGVTLSYLFRSMIEEFLLTHDLVRKPDSLAPVWVKRNNGHA